MMLAGRTSQAMKHIKKPIYLAVILLLPTLGALKCMGQNNPLDNDTSPTGANEEQKDEGASLDWPQWYGNPAHNNFRPQKNEIVCPKILWKVDFSPVPAVVGNDVYAGGHALRHIDLRTGRIKASFKPQEMTEQFNFRGAPRSFCRTASSPLPAMIGSTP